MQHFHSGFEDFLSPSNSLNTINDFLPSPSRSQQMAAPPEPASLGDFFPLKDFFSNCCQSAHSQRSYDGWGFLCFLVGSFPYSINRLQRTFVVICCINKIEFSVLLWRTGSQNSSVINKMTFGVGERTEGKEEVKGTEERRGDRRRDRREMRTLSVCETFL